MYKNSSEFEDMSNVFESSNTSARGVVLKCSEVSAQFTKPRPIRTTNNNSTYIISR